MKNNDKTEENKENTNDLIWNFELEWPDIEFKWDIAEIEWPEINFDWETDKNLSDTKKKSEDNERELQNHEVKVKKQKRNSTIIGE